MDDLIEILLELILEGGSELLQSKKVPKWIRFMSIGPGHFDISV